MSFVVKGAIRVRANLALIAKDFIMIGIDGGAYLPNRNGSRTELAPGV
ncbi:hypothetical protein [Mesorhizobium sp. M0208]